MMTQKGRCRLLLLICMTTGICFTGCSHSTLSTSDDVSTPVPSSGMTTEDTNSTLSISDWFSFGKDLKALDSVDGINNTAILVNEHSITEKEIEMQRISDKYNNPSKSYKEIVDTVIQATVARLEAERLNIKPSQDRIDAYIKSVKDAYESDSFRLYLQSYLDGADLTIDDYLSVQEQTFYMVAQREALWESVQASGKYKDKDAYEKTLVEKATVQFVDPEVEILYSSK